MKHFDQQCLRSQNAKNTLPKKNHTNWAAAIRRNRHNKLAFNCQLSNIYWNWRIIRVLGCRLVWASASQNRHRLTHMVAMDWVRISDFINIYYFCAIFDWQWPRRSGLKLAHPQDRNLVRNLHKLLRKSCWFASFISF